MCPFLETKEFLAELFKFFPVWATKYEINGVSTEMGEPALHKDWGGDSIKLNFSITG